MRQAIAPRSPRARTPCAFLVGLPKPTIADVSAYVEEMVARADLIVSIELIGFLGTSRPPLRAVCDVR